MCHRSCIEFGRANLKEGDIKGKSVIEVGSWDDNGTLRYMVEALCPLEYIGVDIHAGKGVDQICDAEKLIDRFGHERFDVLIATELLEHVRDWRKIIRNFKHILKPDGILLITARSRGTRYHGFPFDFWRYEISDFEAVFSDFIIEVLEKDPQYPGVFMKARKPRMFSENDISGYRLYSIISNKSCYRITKIDFFVFVKVRQFLSKVLPRAVKIIIRRCILGKCRRKIQQVHSG